METKVFLWCSRYVGVSRVAVENWFLIVETPGGILITAIPIASVTTALRLQREGIPVKDMK